MAHIEDIQIQISLETKAVSQQGFSRPLILGSHEEPDVLIDHYGEYADLPSMIEAGFASGDPEYKMAANIFAQTIRPDYIAVAIRDFEDSISDALTKVLEEHSGWYAILITERDKASLHEAGEWALSNKRLFFGCTGDLTALSGRNNIREAYLIHNAPETYPEAAWVGMCLSQDPGSITWKWKSPTGVTESSYTTTELNTIRTGNAQTISKQSGVIYTNEGITTGGEYIDIIQARDFVEARLREDLLGKFIKTKKVPFDDSGFAQIEAALRARFDQCGKQGIIAQAVSEEDMVKSDGGKYMYTVSLPKRADIMENDRAARNLSGIEFSFTIAGAVHRISINGAIMV